MTNYCIVSRPQTRKDTTDAGTGWNKASLAERRGRARPDSTVSIGSPCPEVSLSKAAAERLVCTQPCSDRGSISSPCWKEHTEQIQNITYGAGGDYQIRQYAQHRLLIFMWGRVPDPRHAFLQPKSLFCEVQPPAHGTISSNPASLSLLLPLKM